MKIPMNTVFGKIEFIRNICFKCIVLLTRSKSRSTMKYQLEMVWIYVSKLSLAGQIQALVTALATHYFGSSCQNKQT